MLEIRHINDQYAIANFTESTKKLNVLVADKVKSELNKCIDNGCNHLILDLSNILFIDSSGFGALVTVYNHAKNMNSKVFLTNISDETMELIQLTKLDQVFDIFATVSAAEKEII